MGIKGDTRSLDCESHLPIEDNVGVELVAFPQVAALTRSRIVPS